MKVWYSENVRGKIWFRAGDNPNCHGDPHWRLAGSIRVGQYHHMTSAYPPPRPPQDILAQLIRGAR